MSLTHITGPALAAVAVGGLLAGCTSTGGTAEQQVAKTSNSPTAGRPAFDHPKPNPYYPLVPGTVSRYEGSDEGEKFLETVTVTDDTKLVQGVHTTVILDETRRTDGSIAERTHDWYATANDGTVWYYGEDTATYDEDGKVDSREGSWEAGVDGAVAGVIMPADPQPVNSYRQEFYRGHAEDQAWTVARGARITVPYGKVSDVVRSYEWTRLEPEVMSLKFYGPGLGIVREQDVAGGDELFELVSVSKP